MDMYFFHFSVFTLQLLVGGAVALFAIEMYRLTSARPHDLTRRSRRRRMKPL